MQFLKFLKKITTKLDLFYSNQILRYNQDSQYKTFLGGIISLIIISTITFSFSDMILSTIQRNSIDSKMQVIQQSDPPLLQIKNGQDNMFMFAVQVNSIDLTYIADLINGPQIFELNMTVTTLNNGIFQKHQNFTLEACTKEHWKMMPSMLEDEAFQTFGIKDWLCPSIGSLFTLQGRYTSKENIVMKVDVHQCRNQTSNNRCAPIQEIKNIFANYSNFLLSYYYINPVINPNKPNYISYFLEGDDFTIFSRQMGSQASLHVSEYTITSDYSIFPIEDIVQQKGVIVLEKSQKLFFKVTNNSPLATLYVERSPYSIHYKRQVLKISEVISFMGGLIGAITALLFLIKIYTDLSLEINLGMKLFSKNLECDKQDETLKKFNLLTFVKHSVFKAGRKLNLIDEESWKECLNIEQYQNEITRQLDVKQILKRLIMLQICMTYLFTEDQLEGIKNQEEISCQKAKQIRQTFLKSAFMKRQIDVQKTVILKKSPKEVQILDEISNNLNMNNQQIDTPLEFLQSMKKQLQVQSQISDNRDFHHDSSLNSKKPQQTNIFEIKEFRSKTIKDIKEVSYSTSPNFGLNKIRPVTFKRNSEISQIQFDKIKEAQQIEKKKPCLGIENLLSYADVQNLLQLKQDSSSNPTSLKIWNNLNQDIKKALADKPNRNKKSTKKSY